MIDQDLKDLWTPTGLLLGFQVTLFKWRIEREANVGDEGDIPWLVPADYVGIGGMLCFLFGVILLPSAGITLKHPLIYVIAKVLVNTRDCWRKAAKRSASGVSLCSGMLGMRS
jgi:hypothetical protein